MWHSHERGEKRRSHPISGADLRQRKLERYKFIDKERNDYPVILLCRVMQVRRSCYYSWRANAGYGFSVGKIRQTARIKECFYFHRRRYGSRRIAAELRIGRLRARSVMKREGLRAIAPKRFKPQTTDSKHGLATSPNLLQNPLNAPTGKGEVFVGDITYLAVRGGFCYLACLQDKFTRRIVAWQVSERMTAQLVIDVFVSARRRGLIGKCAIIHTDRGSQYASVDYRRLL